MMSARTTTIKNNNDDGKEEEEEEDENANLQNDGGWERLSGEVATGDASFWKREFIITSLDILVI